MNELEKNLNGLLVFILAGILLGALGIQWLGHEEPCPLCLLQRLGMLGVAVGALLNMKFGIRTLHYGVSLFSCVMGGFVALRQIFLHSCPGFPVFGKPVWGLSLYVWSFLVFVSCVAFIALLLMLFDHRRWSEKATPMNGWCISCSILIFFVSFANIVGTLIQCGLGPCKG